MQPLQQLADSMGRVTPVINPSDHVVVVKLVPAVGRSVTVPATARLVLFHADGPFWVRFGGSATVPDGDILDGTAPEPNPAGRMVKGGDSIGLAAAQETLVSLVFYR